MGPVNAALQALLPLPSLRARPAENPRACNLARPLKTRAACRANGCRARLNCIAQLLSLIPYKKEPLPNLNLPQQQKPDGYREPDYRYRGVKERY